MSITRPTYPLFPFTALVGQDDLKLALIINAIHPGVMGVLIRGQKGTAKSTAARALARLLPPIAVAEGCLYGCDPEAPDYLLCTDCLKKKQTGTALKTETVPAPFITLPINATEDNLVGSLNFEDAIKSGERIFQPGLLARAHRGILYVDEVNLLGDHIVDLLLSAAASGINVVEREGVSMVHPSRFILIGTMNPEEGELRPQLLDRFGLCIQVDSIEDLDLRVEVLLRTEDFQRDSTAFSSKWAENEKQEQQRIEKAIESIGQVKITDDMFNQIVNICRKANVSGHRADLVIEKAAKAIAAYMGRGMVQPGDVKKAAKLALPHRVRSIPKTEKEETYRGNLSREEGEHPDCQKTQGVQAHEELYLGNQDAKMQGEDRTTKSEESKDKSVKGSDEQGNSLDEISNPSSASDSVIFDIGEVIPISLKEIYNNQRSVSLRKSSGKRHQSSSTDKRGRYVRATMHRSNDDIALDATIRAAAPYQIHRNKKGMAISIEHQDIREKIRETKTSTLLVFIVDASGSMGSRLMKETKGAIIYLLQEAYEKRDRVCLVAFRDDRAEILLPPTDSIELAKKKLENLPTGGKTPLCAGLLSGYNLIRSNLYRNHNIQPLIVLITDGRANVSVDPRLSGQGKNTFLLYNELYAMAESIRNETRLKSLVIDVEEKAIGAFCMAEKIAGRMGAKYMVLDDIRSGSIARAVREELKV